MLVYVGLAVALRALFWTVFVYALLSWVPGLTARDRFFGTVERMTARVAEPLLEPIRERMPSGIVVDLSPLVLLVLIQLAGYALGRLVP